jgi:Cu-Zn family superoxide dismutase
MVGDLGNIVVDENTNSVVEIKGNTLVQLLGPHSVLGRSIVIYAGEDDQGRGGHENSGTTGNPGPRIASGVIGLSL